MLWTNIFAGFGGQGVLLIGQLLAYAGMGDDPSVTGGSVFTFANQFISVICRTPVQLFLIDN
jgi:Pyruvate/2-oxoacid:ferredoxin oxidoreductase gamma subunit